MEEVLQGLRAIGEASRLRVLHLLSHGELNVTEITQVLKQSQPRISRHLKLMCDAGLLERYREGTWVLFRLKDDGRAAELARAVIRLLPASGDQLQRDSDRLAQVREARQRAAQQYFEANARNWDHLRSLYVSEKHVEAALLKLVGDGPIGTLLDLGTGTGRVLQLLGSRVSRAIGIDASREMLAVARTNLERAGLRDVQVRQGDIAALPFSEATVDLITMHQVLHYLDDPAKAIEEGARVLKCGGRLLMVDFAPHDLEYLREEHAHRRLGIAPEHMAGWLSRAALDLIHFSTLRPPKKRAGPGLTVSLWLASKTKPRDAARHWPGNG
jgi:ubiquinone/menaquinone biosynthesis C-methylase UbiE/DNA-binding transcriptional ArsR family regulator